MVFTSKFVGTGPSSYKKNLPGRGLTKVEKHWYSSLSSSFSSLLPSHVTSSFFHPVSS